MKNKRLLRVLILKGLIFCTLSSFGQEHAFQEQWVGSKSSTKTIGTPPKVCLRTISIRLKVLSALGGGCGEVIDGSGGGYLISISITKVRGKVGQSMEHLQKDVAYPLLLTLYMLKLLKNPELGSLLYMIKEPITQIKLQLQTKVTVYFPARPCAE